MSETTDSQDASRYEDRERLRVSWFDSVSSLLTSLVVFCSLTVSMLLLIWLTSFWIFPGGITQAKIQTSGTRNPPGLEQDFEPPGIEETEEITDPELPDTIAALTDAVSTQAASLVSTDSPLTAANQSNHLGDKRPPGSDRNGRDQRIVPRHLRWQIDVSARNLKAYAAQLDHFGIELGVIGGNIQGVDYVFDLVEGPNSRRRIDTDAENRLYFMWTYDSPLMQFDRQLIQRANIDSAGRYTLRFIPTQLENKLAMLELEYAKEKGHDSVETIAKTVFQSVPDGKQYRFEVTSQRYRKRPSQGR